jgi:hypothetical protein
VCDEHQCTKKKKKRPKGMISCEPKKGWLCKPGVDARTGSARGNPAPSCPTHAPSHRRILTEPIEAEPAQSRPTTQRTAVPDAFLLPDLSANLPRNLAGRRRTPGMGGCVGCESPCGSISSRIISSRVSGRSRKSSVLGVEEAVELIRSDFETSQAEK